MLKQKTCLLPVEVKSLITVASSLIQSNSFVASDKKTISINKTKLYKSVQFT